MLLSDKHLEREFLYKRIAFYKDYFFLYVSEEYANYDQLTITTSDMIDILNNQISNIDYRYQLKAENKNRIKLIKEELTTWK
jgi:hypothetical protein